VAGTDEPASTSRLVDAGTSTCQPVDSTSRHADERAEDVEILRRLLNKSLGLDSTVAVLPDQPQAWHTGSSTILNSIGGTNGGVFRLQDATTALQAGQRVSQAVGPIDGVYLKGAGVVYTLRIPAGTELTYDPHTQRVGLNAGCAKCHQATAVGLISHTTVAAGSNCTSCHTVGEVKPGVQPASEWEQARRQLRGDQPKEPERRRPISPAGCCAAPARSTNN
ncbi:MAG: cytochrome c3 family protein, partial [Gemmataceae bacterium]